MPRKTRIRKNIALIDEMDNVCPPAQIYPIVMAGLVLFNIYRGYYQEAVKNTIFLGLGTVLLWFLCVSNFEFVAYALLYLPVVFFLFILALILFDRSFLNVHHTFRKENTRNENAEIRPCGCSFSPCHHYLNHRT